MTERILKNIPLSTLGLSGEPLSDGAVQLGPVFLTKDTKDHIFYVQLNDDWELKTMNRILPGNFTIERTEKHDNSIYNYKVVYPK